MKKRAHRQALSHALALSCLMLLTACNPEEVKQPLEQLGTSAMTVKEDLKANAEQVQATAEQVRESAEQVQATATKAMDAAQNVAVTAATQLKAGLESVGVFMGAEAPEKQP